MSLADSSRVLRRIGLFAGPALALIIFLLMPEQYASIGGDLIAMEHSTRTIAAVVGWMAVWWITEAIPVYATALLPLALLPAVGGLSIREVSAPYANEVIYLYLGGFVVALSMQRWQLHKRVAFSALRLAGNTPRRIIGTFMAIAAAGSMWISNTATTMMLLPVVLSVIALVAEREDMPANQENRNLATGLLFGTAYGAIIGGIGTIVGTPPNVFVASFLQSQLDIEISFARWMSFGVPIVLVFVPLGWLLLTRWLLPVGEKPVEGVEELIDQEQKNLGPMTTPEWRVLWVFLIMATLWITRPLISNLEIGDLQPFSGLSDSGIAIIAALSLFCIPAGSQNEALVDWPTAQKLPWGMLLLYGGGLSLAAMMDRYGVSSYVGSLAIGMGGLPQVVIVLSVLAIMMLLTELTSNTATTATLVPIFAAIAPAFNMDPLWLIIPAGLGASCAFMLPVATPPNAIIFSTERFTIGQMVRAGIWFNLLGLIVIGIMVYLVAMPLLGVS